MYLLRSPTITIVLCCWTEQFVFPPQNFHPACFEDYKNVSDFRIKALNVNDL